MADEGRMGDVAAVDSYDPFAAEQFVPQPIADALPGVAQADYAKLMSGRSPDTSPVLYPMPGGGITQQDMDRGIGIGMATSGGGLATKPIRAYHGSPHDFDAFDLSKIGTGEGAQAYGHGLYFAENEGVARGYRDTLSGDYFRTPTGRLFDPQQELEHLNVRSRAHSNGSNLDATIELAQKMAASDAPSAVMAQRDLAKLQALKDEGGITRHNGRMYEVNINADPAHFLDWDKPLREQQQVLDALSGSRRKAVKETLERQDYLAPTRNTYGTDIGPVTGEDFYKALSYNLTGKPGAAQSSGALQAGGIPGIKYLDQGSRNLQDAAELRRQIARVQANPQSAQSADLLRTYQAQLADAEKASSNYVVFNPAIIDILKKYGIAGAAAPVGMGALAAQDQYETQ